MEPSEVAGTIAERFAGAWNRHDMDEFALVFHDDASFVNVIGVHMRGRDEIRQGHARVHAGPYRSSSLVVEVEDARELAPNVVVALLSSQLEGDERAPGVTRTSRFTVVIESRGPNDWKIAAAQNTFLPIPEA
jgi:uncharacterized protein (TIGR02246 family)